MLAPTSVKVTRPTLGLLVGGGSTSFLKLSLRVGMNPAVGLLGAPPGLRPGVRQNSPRGKIASHRYAMGTRPARPVSKPLVKQPSKSGPFVRARRILCYPAAASGSVFG